MLEKRYEYNQAGPKLVERVFEDEHASVNHMVFKKGDALPEHLANSNVYILVARGIISLQLGEQEAHMYPAGSIINVPYGTKMNVSNQKDDILEFFVFKAPGPANYGKITYIK